MDEWVKIAIIVESFVTAVTLIVITYNADVFICESRSNRTAEHLTRDNEQNWSWSKSLPKEEQSKL